MPAVWTNNQIVSNLLRDGSSWSGQTVNYSFSAVAPAISFNAWYGEGNGFSPFSQAQKDMAVLALKLWDDLISVDFVENNAAPQITLQNSTTNVSYAHAYMPGGSPGGSVWFNPNYNATTGTNDLVTPKIGSWGALAYMHEIGHALGLDHPGDYNGGSPTYAANALYSMDTIQYTIMSYFGASNTGADWIASDNRSYYAQTPMVHDILAIQALYGAETTTRTGDTRYGFNSTADSAIYDFTQNKHPIMTLWDAAGNDWLDLSGFTTASRIDLNPGAFSDCDAMTNNIAIAYGCNIENAAGGAGNDTILGNVLANILNGNAGNDTLNGGAGNDTLTGGAGADILIGGDGNDIFYADIADFLLQFDGGAGYDILYLSGTQTITYNYLAYGIEELVLTDAPPPPPPPPPPVTLNGTTAANTLTGGDGAEIINGLDGNDILNGGAGNDTLNGDAGNDTLNGGAGNDALNGGLGTDTVSYSDATGAITVSLAIATAQATGGSGSDTLSGIEYLRGSGFDDRLTGSTAGNKLEGLDGNDVISGGAGADSIYGGNGNDTLNGDSENDVIYGGAGNDTINGGAGIDVASYVDATATVTVNLAITSAQSTGSAGIDTLISIESLRGSNFNDVLTGDAGVNKLEGMNGNDLLSGGAGVDTLMGGTGNDTLYGDADNDTLNGGAGDDILNGGTGTDTATYSDATAAVTVSLAVVVAQATGGSGSDTLVDVENLFGSAFDDSLSGSTGNNTLSGLAGNDVLNGGDGIDSLLGGAGDDTLNGDAGNDTLNGGDGNDTINGGLGTDTVNYSDATAAVTVNLALTVQQATGGSGNDTLAGLENIRGSAFADTLTGSSLTNYLYGLDGNDTLSGGDGADRLIGGNGADSLAGGTGADIFYFYTLAESNPAQYDTITDFTDGVDKINLSAIDAIAGGVNDAFTFGGSLLVSESGGMTFITADTNGDSVVDFKLALTGSHTLHATDFVL